MSVPEEKLVTPEGAVETPEVPISETPPVVIETSVGISGKPKKTVQERIDEITRARREAEREKEYWRKIALEKEAALKPPESSEPKPAMSGLPPRPVLAQFETQEQYEDALISWHDQKKTTEQSVAKQRATEEEGLRKFNKTAEKLRQEYEDFDEVIESPVFSPAMRSAILHSENGPSLAYHLGKNQDLADRIRTLPAEAQFYEIGKIETQILLTQSTKKVTNAPPPITPVGTGGGAGEIDPGKLSIEEWMAWNREHEWQLRKKKLGGM